MEDNLLKWVEEHADPKTLSPLLWAYVGDAVFELYVRTTLVTKGQKIHKLHKETVEYVKSTGQAQLLQGLLPYLNEEEKDIVRRGRNTKSLVPKNADMATYRLSTGFEALIGYLCLANKFERANEIIYKAMAIVG